MDQLCPLAVGVFGEPWERRCPALEPDGERFTCGLIAHPMVYAMRRSLLCGVEAMSKAAAHLVGAGRGCDAQLEGEVADEAFRARMRASRNDKLTDRSLKVWGLCRTREMNHENSEGR
jgi:hypothetical protein